MVDALNDADDPTNDAIAPVKKLVPVITTVWFPPAVLSTSEISTLVTVGFTSILLYIDPS